MNIDGITSYLQKNLSACQKHQPELYATLMSVERTRRYQVIMDDQRSRIPNLFDRSIDRLHYKAPDPLVAIEQEFASSGIHYSRLAFMAGIGLGYHLLAYNRRFKIHPDSTVVIIENDPEVLFHAFSIVDFEPFLALNQIRWLVGVTAERLYSFIYSILDTGHAKFMLKAMAMIENECSVISDRTYYLQLREAVQRASTDIQAFYGNDPLDSLIGIENTLDNFETIVRNPGVKQLRGVFSGRPGLVVSTGPSLDKQIELLRSVTNRAVIAAADASLRVMRCHELKPHFVTSLERKVNNYELFDGLRQEDFDDVFCACCPVLHPATYGAMPGEHIVVFRDYATFEWLGLDKGTIETGPSSGNMAFALLQYLGCDPIILIGQDLAFAEGKSHARGFVHGEFSPGDVARPKFKIPGNVEAFVETHDLWMTALKAYERAAAGYGGRLINATEGGAKIVGATTMSFADAIDCYLSDAFSVHDIVRQFLTEPDSQTVANDLGQFQQTLRSSYAYMRHTRQRLSDLERAFTRLDQQFCIPATNGVSIDRPAMQKEVTLLKRMLTIIEEPQFRQIAMHVVQSVVLKAMLEVQAIKASSLAIDERELKILAILNRLISEVEPWLDRLEHLIGSRLQS